MNKMMGLIVSAALFAGCASWFQTRVEQSDARIAALERDRVAAVTDEERERIDAALVAERKDREKTLGGALQEQKNKQALLMAILTIGVGGLKLAAKGVL